ncbi:MAG TPA: hypothetical protein VIL46_18885, partial [Gemmataceae bacterium]
MRTAIALVGLVTGGCSTAPVADFLDFACPGRLSPAAGRPFHGGVIVPGLPAPEAPPPGGAIPLDPTPAPDPVGSTSSRPADLGEAPAPTPDATDPPVRLGKPAAAGEVRAGGVSPPVL